MLMFKIPLASLKQHLLAWDVVHWDSVPPVGIAATALTVAKHMMADMKCILSIVLKICAVVDIDLEA
jgi:hypothetical protein